VPISFVHYRGLARQLHDAKPSDPMASWKLRHAWFALFALFAAGCASLYFIGPISFPEGWDWTELQLTSRQNGTALLVQDVLLLVLLTPLAISARARGYLLSQHWSYAKGLSIACGVALLLRIPMLIVLMVDSYRHFLQKDALPDIMQVLLSMRVQYGVVPVFLVAAVIAPICEEFIFRGVLLSAFSSRISFIAANVLQAALFTAMHVTSEGVPILFIFAIAAGVLAKRSGGLVAPIVLHATFNAIALVAVVVAR
jgi:membrane protease YdiL (CAAX protease family)